MGIFISDTYYILLARASLSLLIATVVLLIAVAILLVVLVRKNRKEALRLKKMTEEYDEKLQIETATINTIVDTLSDVLFCKGLDLKYTRANKSFNDLFGFDCDDVIGKNDEEIGVRLDVVEAWKKVDLEVINEKREVRLEEIAPSEQGDKVFETIKSPLMREGKIYGILGLARDITERKEYENRLKTASRAKSEFLANISHEIRTPMNSIVGFSELALEVETSPKTRSYLQKISENANWLLQIINDILDASRLESGRIVLDEFAFDLGELVNQCKGVVLPTVLEKTLNFYVYAEPIKSNKLLLGDAVRLRQVLVNIISNAVKFTDEGGIKVISSVLAELDNSITVHWEISDTGMGMTQEQIDRVYEPFMQADTSTTREQGGVGLGLPIVNGILGAMGSELDIRSQLGEGTTISFSVTFSTVDKEDVEEQSVPLLSKKPYFTGRVLICEDNEMNQMVISDHLNRVGLSHVIAGNGKEGVEMAAAEPFDLILMDIHMPVMDGIEATKRIITSGSKTPIVALTANIMPENVQLYKETGMSGYLGKPFVAQDLWAELYKYLTPIDSGDSNGGKYGSFKFEHDEDGRLIKALAVSFVKDNKDFYEKLENALKNGDYTLAYRLAHTLKSSAGILGKTHLQHAAVELEASLRHDSQKGQANKEVAGSTMRKMRMELDAALEELMPVYEAEISKQLEAGDNAELTPEEVKELVRHLETLLKSRNADSINLTSQIRSLPGSGELVEQIEAFNFKDALKTLSRLKGKWVTV
ncbi:MAG: ATP-binding protein [Defluviitaleaceae bacterium]|nr:ATP-binding protein [Defluviitaleaceae bacterium]